MMINHIIDGAGIEKPIKSVERDIAVSLIRYLRRVVTDYVDSLDQEVHKKSIEFATNLVDGKADKLQELM